VRVIALSTLRAYWTAGHADAEGPLRSWNAEVSAANWGTMADIKARYPHASIIDSERVVFNIHGNSYRLITKIWFPAQMVYVKFIGTHAEYDKINVKDL
jgi:mRNA interferase HigB